MQITPNNIRRYEVNQHSESCMISIRYKKRVYAIIGFPIIWIGVFVVTDFDLIWFLMGLPFLYLLVQNVFGKEIIELKKTEIRHIRKVFDFTEKSKTYFLKDVKNIRVSEGLYIDEDERSEIIIRNYQKGRIAFDYGVQTFRIGSGLTEVEGNEIVEIIKKYYDTKFGAFAS